MPNYGFDGLPQYLKTAEAAAYAHTSKAYLELARYRGTGPPFLKIGRMVRYRRASLDLWLIQHEQQSIN